MKTHKGLVACAWAALVVLHLPAAAPGGDWPQWRYDHGRTAASPEGLAAELHLQWSRRLPPPRPAWPKYPRMAFDASYEPVVMGKTMFVGSMIADSLTAMDTETGEEKWRFYADGPVRFAPAAWGGRVFCVSDDGFLYCLDAATGKLLWKFRGRPAGLKDHKVLGNERLISLFPARGGAVLAGSTVYFAAGIWPFEGVYIHAVDAETGKAVWSNSDSGEVKDGLFDHALIKGPRGASGLAPQGYLAIVGQRLIVPCGRALPGFLDLKTGELQPYVTGWGGRVTLAKGSWSVSAVGKYFTHTGDLCELATGAHLEVDPANDKELGEIRDIVLTPDAIYYSRPINKSPRDSYRPVGAGYDAIVACDLTKPTIKLGKDKRREDWKRATLRGLWRLPSELKVHIKAGERLYAGAAGAVAAVDIPTGGGPGKVSWRAEVPGTPSRMLAADGKLFVVMRDGAIHCFGPERGQPRRHEPSRARGDAQPGPWASMAGEVLKETTSYQIAKSQPGEPTVAVQWESKPVDIQWPTTWRVFGPLPRTSKLLPGSAVKTMPRALTADGNEYEGRELSTVEDTLDLTCLYGGYGLKPLAPGEKPTAFPRPKARSDAKAQSKLAYAMAEIDCPAAGRLTIGACADWWMAWYLDGNCIYDPNTNEDTWAYCGRRGRLFWADVSAGRHVLAVALRASRGGWNVTAEGGAKSEPKFQAAMAGIPHSDVMQGYALVWGIGSGRLAEEIARQSRLHVIVVDPDAKKVEAFRRRLDAAGLYGTRVAVLPGDPLSLDLPPYFAELITSEDISGLLADPAADSGKGKAFAAKVFGCLRPYGGVACLPVEADRQKTVAQWAAAAGLEEAQVTRAGELALLRRKGAVDGSTDWTHEGADASNSLASRDWSVKAPLRVLWFGGSMDLLFPDWDFTHSRHPIPLVVGGRVFIQQAWTLAAADIYTGRLLWKVALPAPEHAYHSYAAAEDGVYVVCDGEVLRLDAATGRTLAHIAPFKGARGPWRQLRLWHDLLIGRVGNSLVAVDRAGGQALWSHQCKHGPVDFAIGGGKAYLLDCPAPGKGYKATSEARLIALDAKGGQVLWEAPETVWTGPRSEPHLAYSHLNDLLVVQHRDLHAYNATTGKPLWKQQAKQAVPYVLHRSAVVNAKTGEQFDPLTGGKRPQRLWTNRLRGCSHAVASEYLLTVRDGHATYFDLPSGKRTFMRGLRSGCTPSLIPADGLLNIPNFARGCSCNYSIFTSSALVPVPAEP